MKLTASPGPFQWQVVDENEQRDVIRMNAIERYFCVVPKLIVVVCYNFVPEVKVLN